MCNGSAVLCVNFFLVPENALFFSIMIRQIFEINKAGVKINYIKTFCWGVEALVMRGQVFAIYVAFPNLIFSTSRVVGTKFFSQISKTLCWNDDHFA